ARRVFEKSRIGLGWALRARVKQEFGDVAKSSHFPLHVGSMLEFGRMMRAALAHIAFSYFFIRRDLTSSNNRSSASACHANRVLVALCSGVGTQQSAAHEAGRLSPVASDPHRHDDDAVLHLAAAHTQNEAIASSPRCRAT